MFQDEQCGVTEIRSCVSANGGIFEREPAGRRCWIFSRRDWRNSTRALRPKLIKQSVRFHLPDRV